MEELPFELLEMILSRLDLYDRLSCAQLCRKLQLAATAPRLMQNVRAVIHASRLREAVARMTRGERVYRAIEFREVNMADLPFGFWKKVGPGLRHLKLTRCRWSNQLLYLILRRCTSLETLLLIGCPFATEADKRASEDLCYEEPLEPSPSLLTLRIAESCELSWVPKTVSMLLALLPSLTFFSLTSRSMTLEEFEETMDTFLAAKQILTTFELDSRSHLHDEIVTALIEKYSEKLRKLILKHCSELTEGVFSALCNCVELQSLSLKNARLFTELHLRRLLLNLPHLEELTLINPGDLARPVLNRLCEWTKLKCLTLCHRLPDRAWDRLRVGQFSGLQHLELTRVDGTLQYFSSIRFLENLRSLSLVDPAPFNTSQLTLITRNLKKLERLCLKGCAELTEADGSEFCELRNLRSLSLTAVSHVSTRTFRRYKTIDALKEIAVDDSSIDDATLKEIAIHNPRLTSLKLRRCPGPKQPTPNIQLDNTLSSLSLPRIFPENQAISPPPGEIRLKLPNIRRGDRAKVLLDDSLNLLKSAITSLTQYQEIAVVVEMLR
ncbi:uncharacterized protein LOC100906642 [Galendromus occidentalis]|uniref:Uncharacterized protein LOC100906642 n=1 Tax=Galendromus occidentalis TaxID=34638 RepID=A0AAJ7P9K1_9ACAR|nr:uncharacterized protein LOC100906642 [Galendromus occidentalis]